MIAFVVDDLNVSFEGISRLRDALHQYIDTRLAPGDRAAILRTGGAVSVLEQFTSDTARLHAAVDALRYNYAGMAGVGGPEAIDGQMPLRGPSGRQNIDHGKALEATPHQQKQLEEQKRIILKRKAKDMEAARVLAGQFESLSLELSRKVKEEGKLYGSVSAKDLVEKLAEQNILLDRKKIFLKEPIRTLGNFEVPVKLDAGVMATLKVSVVEEK